jgi:hypothetical protein
MCGTLGVLLTAGCGRIGYDPLTGDATVDDAALDPISPFAPFTTVELIGEIENEGDYRNHPSLSSDMLTMYLAIENANVASIWQTQRDSLSEPWAPIAMATDLNSGTSDNAPELSRDGLQMHFTSRRDGGQDDLYAASRASTTDPWGNISRISELSTIDFEHSPTLTPNSLRIAFDREGALFESTRASATDTWGPPVPLSELNQPNVYVGDAFLADEGLTIYFDVETDDTLLDFYVATRPSLDAPFDTPVAIDSLNTGAIESDPWLSPDGRTMFFSRSVSAARANLHMATR